MTYKLQVIRNYGRGKKVYSIDSVASFICGVLDPDNNTGYSAYMMDEGTLGYGNLLLVPDDPDHYYAFIIEEVYLNEWSSGQTVRRVRTKNIGKKYWDRVDKFLNEHSEDVSGREEV